MTIKQQVCSLEQAKRLKELGVVQESHAAWMIHGDAVGVGVDRSSENGVTDWTEDFYLMELHDCYAAWTVAELGVMLPRDEDGTAVYFSAHDTGSYKGKDIDGFSAALMFPDSTSDRASKITPEWVYPTEAQCRAALLIYLLESGKITAEEVNERLIGD